MPSQHFKLRRGVTLTELLVVVAIMVVVAAAFVPLVQPILRGQNTREASRQLNVMIAGAQARAVALGRPVGIWMERGAHDASAPPERWFTCYRVFEAVEPVPYTGDFYDARVRLALVDGGVDADGLRYDVWRATFLTASPGVMTQVHVGDTIRFNGRGPRYMISERRPDGILFIVESAKITPDRRAMETPLKYALSPQGVTFEVFRQPIKSSNMPIELPNNVAIDFSLSGYAISPESTYQLQVPVPPSKLLPSFRQLPLELQRRMPSDITDASLTYPEYDIAIMFSPKGGIDRVHYIPHEHDDIDAIPLPYLAEIPYGKVNLLIARDDKIGKGLDGQVNVLSAPARLGIGSLNEQSNIWITIAGHSGRVQAGPNAALPPAMLGNNIEQLIPLARSLADTGQTMGGR